MSAAQDEFNELMRDKERITTHPEDRNSSSSHNASDDDDDSDTHLTSAVEDPAPRPSMSLARATIPRTRFGANTGPKGVISDAQNFRDQQRKHRTSIRGPNGLVSKMQVGLSMNGRGPATEKIAERDEEEADNEEEDDEFMQEWREKRLRQMQNGEHESRMHNRDRSVARRWGSLTAVDGEGFLDAVDKSPADTIVLVYIYDDRSDVSLELEDCVRALARSHKEARFVKLHYHDAEMEPAGVPALLAYRNGEKFDGLVPLINEIPEDADVSDTTLEVVLKKHQML
ncbi:phosducin [Acrodontium crateriforme]|uniref:Phosducin n=1 Tax=Acrodontium crateriforme TaxID=150365 RepID=A0AAQ3M690_9PEZI|nr:phosducin [Acrodontium crateriforme]